MTALIGQWIALLGIVTVSGYVAQRSVFPAPVVLVVVGLMLSLVPGWPVVALNPELVLDAFLPMLIYTGAVVIPWQAFRHNLRPIGVLAVGLVAVTACGVAMLARMLIPGMPWAAAFVLGAVISPPDDVAVALITKRLGIPRRITLILEGEGLVNDVTALTLFRFALSAVAGAAVSVHGISLVFAATLAGSLAYGILVGWLALWLRRRIKDTNLEITVSLITPFVAYLLPEHFGVTGILSVVAAGILVSAQSPRMIPATTRLQAHQLWKIISFWLNSLLFVLLGLQLKAVIVSVAPLPAALLWGLGLGFSALVIALRFAGVYLSAHFSRLVLPWLRRTDPTPPARHLFVVAFAGMRGAISMAAVLAIPITLPGGQPFPQRNIVVFVTFAVILVTLVGQGLLLPFVVRRLGIEADGLSELEDDALTELHARQRAVQAGLARLDELARAGRIPADIVERQRHVSLHALGMLDDHLRGHRDAAYRQRAELALEAQRAEIEAQRGKLLDMLENGEIEDEMLVLIERDLDLMETRLPG